MNAEGQSVSEFLEHLASLGIEVEARGDRLLCHGSRKAVTKEIQRELALRKREIVAFFQPTSLPAVDDHPLSFAQQRLWFLDQMQPGSISYSLSMAQYLFGPLNTQALDRAVTGLVRKHEALRSIFPVAGDAPVQRVLPPFKVKVSMVALVKALINLLLVVGVVQVKLVFHQVFQVFLLMEETDYKII